MLYTVPSLFNTVFWFISQKDAIRQLNTISIHFGDSSFVEEIYAESVHHTEAWVTSLLLFLKGFSDTQPL